MNGDPGLRNFLPDSRFRMPSSPPDLYFYHPLAETPGILEDSYPLLRSDQNATVQAVAHLRRRGYPVHFVNEFPDGGILFSHPSFIEGARLPRHQFVVSLRTDKHTCRRANVEIVQNPLQARDRAYRPRVYAPLFPQKNLIPRDPGRGDRFVNVAYLGRLHNIRPELRNSAFASRLESEGMRLQIRSDPAAWNDYSDVDAILAVRDYHRKWKSKPASKLVNAWRAGVPAVVGPESAFQYLRQSELDYLEARSFEEVQAALLRLRDDPGFRRRMTENARERAKEFTFDAVADAWIGVIHREIIPRWNEWIRSRYRRWKFHARLKRKA